MNLRSLFLAFVFVLMFFPVSLAKAALDVQFQISEPLELDAEAIVTIEVTEDGEAVEVEDMNVTYIPADGVFDDVVYDCNDPDVMENCRANNRGVPGIFEAVFDLKALPLTVAVDADGSKEEVELALSEEAEVEVAAEAADVEENLPENSAITPVIAPEDVQVGPSPSWWVIFAPMFLMCVVVTYFVVKTTD